MYVVRFNLVSYDEFLVLGLILSVVSSLQLPFSSLFLGGGVVLRGRGAESR
jgi:hypothetical protein